MPKTLNDCRVTCGNSSFLGMTTRDSKSTTLKIKIPNSNRNRFGIWNFFIGFFFKIWNLKDWNLFLLT
jgi:hypothetical protein